ncbi:hypothetical protein U1Q18_000410, partial [Sarracenia purpurea var. burkii]
MIEDHAEGEGLTIFFVYSFPELWYSWHRQILSVFSLSYRIVTLDLRGYGDTDAPPSVAAYTIFHIIGDLDALRLDRVFLVDHNRVRAL